MTAKLRVLELPGDLESNEVPFALILSDVDETTPAELDEIGPALASFKDACGARAVLVTPFEIEVS